MLWLQLPKLVHFPAQNAKHYSVPDHPGSGAQAGRILGEILLDILSLVEHDNHAKVEELVHDEVSNVGGLVQGSFLLEPSLTDDVQVLIKADHQDNAGSDKNDLIETFELRSPSGKKLMFPTFYDGFVQFHLEQESESGRWSYEARIYSDPSRPFPMTTVQVSAKSNNST